LSNHHFIIMLFSINKRHWVLAALICSILQSQILLFTVPRCLKGRWKTWSGPCYAYSSAHISIHIVFHSADATYDFHWSWGLQIKRNSGVSLLNCQILHWICRKQRFGSYPRRYCFHQQAYWWRGWMDFRDCPIFLLKRCEVQACWTVQQANPRFRVQGCFAFTEHAHYVILWKKIDQLEA